MLLHNIKLTNQELNSIRQNYFDFGSESLISKSNRNTIYKIFKKDPEISLEEDKVIRENKLNKIIELLKLSNLENSVKILNTISCNNEFVGYEMTYDKDDETFLSMPLNNEDKLLYLKLLKDKLLHLEENNIVYGDIKNDNILINRRTNEISLCDLDNIKIKSYEMDLLPPILKKFKKEYGVIDEKTHSFMHNLFLLNELQRNSYWLEDELFLLEAEVYPNFFDNESKEISKEMVKINKSYSGKYFIDRLVKDKQVKM